MAVTTSIRMPEAVHEQYEMLAQATGRTRNELMVEALRSVAERHLREIAMVQEGLAQSHAGMGIPLEQVVAQLKADGLLAADFIVEAETEQTTL